MAFKNFEVYLKWNDSFIYTVTAAHLAKRLSGAKKYIHKNYNILIEIQNAIIITPKIIAIIPVIAPLTAPSFEQSVKIICPN